MSCINDPCGQVLSDPNSMWNVYNFLYPKWVTRTFMGLVNLSSSLWNQEVYISLVDKNYIPCSSDDTFNVKLNDDGDLVGACSASWIASTLLFHATDAAPEQQSTMLGSCLTGSDCSSWSENLPTGSSPTGDCYNLYTPIGISSSALVFPAVLARPDNIAGLAIWLTSSAPGEDDDRCIAYFGKDDGSQPIDIVPDGDNITVSWPDVSGWLFYGIRS
jgi:hypothetical protein